MPSTTMTLLLFCLTFLPLAVVDAYRVAMFAPYLSNSQVLWNKRVGEALAAANNTVDIYMLYYFEDHTHPKVDIDPRITVYTVNATMGVYGKDMHQMQGEFVYEDLSPLDSRSRRMMSFMSNMTRSCKVMVENATLLQQIKDAKYDIAFTHMYNFCPIGLIHAAGIQSWVWLNSGALMDNVAALHGVPLPPSYCTPMMMDAGEKLTFYERIKSFIGHALFGLVWTSMVANGETAHFRAKFGADFPDLVDLAADAPLVMVNSNELYDFARPTLHKIINIGGLGIKNKDAKPLKDEYAKLAAAADGHVVFSFGSVAPAYLMPERWLTSLLGAFAKFPRVQFFMRHEKPEEIAHLLPKNVFASKWLPQTDLLQHEKALGMVTHGGFNSIQDAIHAGTPIVTIPLFGDQPRNGHLAVKLGFGVNLHKADVVDGKVEGALQRLVSDKSLRAAAVRLREMVARKPVSAEQLLLRWTDFAVHFKRLDNLVPFGAKMNVFTYHSIDVILFLSVVAFSVIALLFCALRCLFRRCCCRGSAQKAKKE